MYAIAGVTGHTGRVVATSLLDQGEPVRVIVRTEEKGRSWRDRGAEAAVSSLDDPSALRAALDGVNGLYYLVPPDVRAADALAAGRRLVDVLCDVLGRSTVEHVVFLSSIGAQHETGTGPIRALHYGEEKLRTAAARCTFVRAAYFMENTTAMLPAIQAQGVLPSFISPDLRIPMVATQDIGEVAAHALLRAPATTEVIELAGPAEYSMNDVAAAYSRALGKTVRAARVPDEGIIPALKQAGFSDNIAELYREMSSGMESGRIAFTGGATRSVRGEITLDAFVVDDLPRMMRAA